jgi:single-stranded DNA-binding protein
MKETTMHCFTLTAIGHLGRNPELVRNIDSAYVRFCLVGSDYVPGDEEGAAREVTSSIWFLAFGGMGEAIARFAKKGDQLFVEARVRTNLLSNKEDGAQSFIVTGFRYGATGSGHRKGRETGHSKGPKPAA